MSETTDDVDGEGGEPSSDSQPPADIATPADADTSPPEGSLSDIDATPVEELEQAPEEEAAPEDDLARIRAWGRRLRPAWQGLAAYLLYQSVAFWIQAVPVLSNFGRQHVGGGVQDSRYFQWALSWTPWALLHGMTPFRSNYVFAPEGVDLSWSTIIPAPAIVLWPITKAFGPMAALNVATVAAPALAAWAAYLLCRRLTHRFWSSLAGGFLFGFSAYFAANMVGFVNLLLVFPIPLMVYLVIRRVEGSLGAVTFVAGMAALLVFLFGTSTETFGMAAVFGGIAFLVAIVFGREIRHQLLTTGGLVLIAGVIATAILSPYLIAILHNVPDNPLRDNEVATVDLWSFVLPARTILLGGHHFDAVLANVMSNTKERGQGYVGIAGIALLVGFGITEWRRRGTWLLLGFVGFVAMMSLGPVLYVGGQPRGSLPSGLILDLPLLNSAVPWRIAMYTALVVAVIAAIWLARANGRWAWVRWVIVLAAIASVVPQIPRHHAPQQIPAFYTSDEMRQAIHEGEIVYVVSDMRGDEMVASMEADNWFKLAQGYIGVVGHSYADGLLSKGLWTRDTAPYLPDPVELDAWLTRHSATAVIMDDRASDVYAPVLQAAGLNVVYTGGDVTVWRPSGADVVGGTG